MKTIFKYQLAITDEQTLFLPKDAEILSVADQGGMLCMWAAIETCNLPESRVIKIYGTGHTLQPDERYIGTIMQAGGALVWHVFEKP